MVGRCVTMRRRSFKPKSKGVYVTPAFYTGFFILGTLFCLAAVKRQISPHAAHIAEQVGERFAKAKNWPDSARAIAGRLRRVATFLRKVGIDIGFGREGRARTQMSSITTAASES